MVMGVEKLCRYDEFVGHHPGRFGSGTLPLEEAHLRLSALPAQAAQFEDRGMLREGLAADIVIYDLDNLKPIEVAYDPPAGKWRRIQKAGGYRHIMVNGVETFRDGRCTGAAPGGLLHSGRAAT